MSLTDRKTIEMTADWLMGVLYSNKYDAEIQMFNYVWLICTLITMPSSKKKNVHDYFRTHQGIKLGTFGCVIFPLPSQGEMSYHGDNNCLILGYILY